MYRSVGHNRCVPRTAPGVTRLGLAWGLPVRSCRRRAVVSVAGRVSAAPPGVKGRAPPKANPKTSPRKTDQAAPAPAPTNTTPANAKAAAAPGSTTEAKGTASTKTTATRDTAVCTNTTGGTGGRAKAGKAKAAGAPAGLTEKEREAAARVGAAIGRDLDFVVRMASTSKRVLKEPFITAYRYAVLAQGASACPAWQAKLGAATPAMLARWLLRDVPRLTRLTYLEHKGLASSLITMAAVMRPTAEHWEAQHPDFQLWLHTKGFGGLPTCSWVNATLATRAAPAASA